MHRLEWDVTFDHYLNRRLTFPCETLTANNTRAHVDTHQTETICVFSRSAVKFFVDGHHTCSFRVDDVGDVSMFDTGGHLNTYCLIGQRCIVHIDKRQPVPLYIYESNALASIFYSGDGDILCQCNQQIFTLDLRNRQMTYQATIANHDWRWTCTRQKILVYSTINEDQMTTMTL